MEEREKALFEVSIKAGEASSEIPLEGGKKKKKNSPSVLCYMV